MIIILTIISIFLSFPDSILFGFPFRKRRTKPTLSLLLLTPLWTIQAKCPVFPLHFAIHLSEMATIDLVEPHLFEMGSSGELLQENVFRKAHKRQLSKHEDGLREEKAGLLGNYEYSFPPFFFFIRYILSNGQLNDFELFVDYHNECN